MDSTGGGAGVGLPTSPDTSADGADTWLVVLPIVLVLVSVFVVFVVL